VSADDARVVEMLCEWCDKGSGWCTSTTAPKPYPCFRCNPTGKGSAPKMAIPAPVWRRKLLSAYTGTDTLSYPGYINAYYTEGGMVEITVRADRRDGTEGPVATVSLNKWHWANFYQTANKALDAPDANKWPCKRCGAPVFPGDLCPCPGADSQSGVARSEPTP
jgi:hypothetical protein